MNIARTAHLLLSGQELSHATCFGVSICCAFWSRCTHTIATLCNWERHLNITQQSHHASPNLCRCCHLATLDRNTKRRTILNLKVPRADGQQYLFRCCLHARRGGSTHVATIAYIKCECHLLHIVVIYLICGLLFIDGRIIRKHELLQSVVLFKLWFLQYASIGLRCIKPVLQKLFFIFRLFLPRPVVPY